MNESSRQFLDANRHHYDLLMRAQYVKHLDGATRQRLFDVIRTEFDARYPGNTWCPDCVANALKFAYGQYDAYLSNQNKTT